MQEKQSSQKSQHFVEKTYTEQRPLGIRDSENSAELDSMSTPGDPQLGWAAFARQQSGQSPVEQIQNPTSSLGPSSNQHKVKAKPWEGMVSAQEDKRSRTLNHREKMQIALLSNEVIVNAFRKFLANVEDVRNSPPEAQQVLQVTFILN